MSCEKTITILEKQIEKRKRELSELRQKRREIKLLKSKKGKKSLPRGRPPIRKDLILKAELLAYDRPLTDVALSLGISVKTLYNYGISRKALDGKIESVCDFEEK